MEPKVLKTEADHEVAAREAERLIALDPAADTPDGERLALLALLIEEFERRHYRFEALDPIDIIAFRMEEQGLQPADLIPLLGNWRRVDDVLSGKRALSLPMIRALSRGLGIPADALLGTEQTLTST